MFGNDAMYNGESQPAAIGLCRKEGGKELLQIFAGDTTTRVRYDYFDTGYIVPHLNSGLLKMGQPRLDLDFDEVGGRYAHGFYGFEYQIEEDLV